MTAVMRVLTSAPRTVERANHEELPQRLQGSRLETRRQALVAKDSLLQRFYKRGSERIYH